MPMPPLSADQIGSLAWGARTGGRLERRDRVRIAAQGLLARVAALPAKWRARLGLTPARLARMEVAAIRVPDSQFAREAAELCAAESPAYLHHHCGRAHLWAVLLASADGLKFDEELLYVACMLHDLGLTARYAGTVAGCGCFAIEGALAAHEFATAKGWPPERASALADAIALHLNVRVGPALGMEAHLLHDGTTLDVVGSRVWQIPPAARHAVLARHPRNHLKRQIVAAIAAEGAKRPESRIGFMNRLGFCALVKAAPFAE